MATKPNYQNKDLIPNWSRILIDTSVIIRTINYAKNQAEANKFVYETIRHLADTKCQSEKGLNDRKFYVSAISIAEILMKLDDKVKKSQMIIKAFNANNITIVDFDEDVANIFNSDFCDAMGVKAQNDILTRWGEEPSKKNRDALTNDIMILASGLSVDIDIVLCIDKEMYKIARECGINAVYVDEKYFNVSGSNYFEYYSTSSDKDFNVTLKQKPDSVDGLFLEAGEEEPDPIF
ncbi:MAG: hypothetical protein V4535_09440 [Bacteroidota bacterium]